MESPLFRLPREILDSITQHLSMADVVQLWKCSRIFHLSAKRVLYGDPDKVARTMFWACNEGDSYVIRGSIRHGADPSWILIPVPDLMLISGRKVDYRRAGRRHKKRRVSTLTTAAQHHHEDAFATLLACGAFIGNLSKSDRAKLLRSLRVEGGWNNMYLLLKAGMGPGFIRSFKMSLLLFIQWKAPISILQLLLDLGVDANATVWDQYGDVRTPLTTAIERDQPATVSLLLERGAEINPASIIEDTRHQSLISRRSFAHIPIFTAAAHMGRTGSPEMMELCLRAGADLNHALRHRPRSCLARGFMQTPLLTYLDAVKDLPPERLGERSTGLKFFFNHGLDFRLPDMDASGWGWVPERQRRLTLEMILALQVLLTKWGVRGIRRSDVWEGLLHFVERRIGLVKPRVT